MCVKRVFLSRDTASESHVATECLCLTGFPLDGMCDFTFVCMSGHMSHHLYGIMYCTFVPYHLFPVVLGHLGTSSGDRQYFKEDCFCVRFICFLPSSEVWDSERLFEWLHSQVNREYRSLFLDHCHSFIACCIHLLHVTFFQFSWELRLNCDFLCCCFLHSFPSRIVSHNFLSAGELCSVRVRIDGKSIREFWWCNEQGQGWNSIPV